MTAPSDVKYEPERKGPVPGAAIITADGKQIGRVKECDSRHFKVAVRWARDYWLSQDVIREQHETTVELTIPGDLLAGYKLRRTGRGYEPVVGTADISAAGGPPTDFASR